MTLKIISVKNIIIDLVKN